MKIEVGSTWVNKNDLDNTVTVDTVGAFAVTGHSDKDGLYMANIEDFLHYFNPLPDTYCGSLRELSEQEFENIIDEAFEEGYAQAYSEIQAKTERERALQEKAWDEGYDQAIDDLIEAGVIGEEEYLDEDCSVEEYSEYEFGDVEDNEEYCFSKELARVLNGEFTSNINFDGNKKEELDEYNGGYGEAKVDGTDGSERKHSHYFKDVRHLDYIDVYQVCKLFPVDDDSGAITHARKKLLVAGGRGAGKDMIKDITEARDTLNRYLQIEGIE